MTTHELKILPQYFQAVWYGKKTFELRKDDRDYQRGDILVLKEWDGMKFTGSALCVKVTYILQDAMQYGLQNGYVILGIRRIESNSDFKPTRNADKLRSMSDEELANTLPWVVQDEICKPECDADQWEPESCCKCWLDWLRREVNDG